MACAALRASEVTKVRAEPPVRKVPLGRPEFRGRRQRCFTLCTSRLLLEMSPGFPDTMHGGSASLGDSRAVHRPPVSANYSPRMTVCRQAGGRGATVQHCVALMVYGRATRSSWRSRLTAAGAARGRSTNPAIGSPAPH